VAKITLADMVIEGTIEELTEMGFKFPVEEEPIGTKYEPLKVGDYAKVVGGFEYHIGKVAKVVDVCETMASLREVNDSDFRLYGSPLECLVKATDEEVAEANRKQAEKELEQKWAKIGRKPKEFKKGDIVRYESDGEICDVTALTEGGIEVKTATCGICHEKPEAVVLITPVEARFDV
jgi:hypothetical protein